MRRFQNSCKCLRDLTYRNLVMSVSTPNACFPQDPIPPLTNAPYSHESRALSIYAQSLQMFGGCTLPKESAHKLDSVNKSLF